MITVILNDPSGKDVQMEFDKQGEQVLYTITLTEHQAWQFIDQALPQLQELRQNRYPKEPMPEETKYDLSNL